MSDRVLYPILRLVTLAALLIAGTGGCYAGDIFKWIDSTGRTHYGERPPEGDSKKLDVRETSSSRRHEPADIKSMPRLDGELFSHQLTSLLPNGDRIIEFIRPSESVSNWTKLIGYRYQQLPALSNDPYRTAMAIERAIRKLNPQAPVRISRNSDKAGVTIDFFTWPKDKRFIELNVFRLWKSQNGNAVVSIQLTYRLPTPSSESPQASSSDTERKLTDLQARRQDWIKHLSATSHELIEQQLTATK